VAVRRLKSVIYRFCGIQKPKKKTNQPERESVMNTKQIVRVTGMMEHQAAASRVTHGSAVLFVRDPSNAHDANAIAVVNRCTNERIGFMSKRDAKSIAPFFDSGLFEIGEQGARIERIYNMYHCTVMFHLVQVRSSLAYA
jgi:hypothetical protein